LTTTSPTVGRIVLVPMDPVTNNGAKVAPAVIVHVWSDTTVNVRVFADGADMPWLTSVTYKDDITDATPRTAWTWPPRA
jgi:hypothetical protein